MRVHSPFTSHAKVMNEKSPVACIASSRSAREVEQNPCRPAESVAWQKPKWNVPPAPSSKVRVPQPIVWEEETSRPPEATGDEASGLRAH